MPDSRIVSAMMNGDMVELLTGKDGYAIANPYLDTPTEPIQVFAGIMELIGPDPSAAQGLISAIRQVADDPDYSWFSVYYLFDVIGMKDRFGPGFDLQAFVTDILARVRKQRTHLLKLKRWAGAQDSDGCWGIVDRLVGQLVKYHQDEHLKIVW